MVVEREMDFGKLLQLYRRTIHLTQAGLAERAGYSPNYISMLERGVRLPAPATLDILAQALCLSKTDRAKLESAAPWMGAVPSKNAGVPLEMGQIIGREREIARIIDFQKEGARLLTLTGPGGVGKTRLAEQVVAILLPDLADGSVFVELETISDLDGFISALGQALKIRETPGGLLHEEIKEYLRTKEILLFFDCMEHALGAASFIADILKRSPRLRVLVTSRIPLRLREEQEFPVQPLPFPLSSQVEDSEDLNDFPAVALFVYRARLVQPDFPSDFQTLKIVADICRHLDGLPLAIELAAARVKHLTLTTLGSRLGDRFQILTGGARNSPERHQRMWDTIAWSYDLLEPPEQNIFQQLSTFIGTWNLEAAEAICQTENSNDSVQDIIRILVNSSLVTFSEARYGMLDTIREFATRKLAMSGKATVIRQRHAEYFLHFAEQAGEGLQTEAQRVWYRGLEIEQDNIRAALKWFLENRKVESALYLAISTWRFWMLHGDFREGRHWLEEGLSRSDDVSSGVRTKALWGAYWLAYHQGDYPHSAELSAQSLILSDISGDALDRRNALTGIGIAALAQGHFSEAVEPLQESVEICRKLGKKWYLATSLLNLSFARMYLGDHPQALSLLEEALQIYHDLGDRAYTAKTQNSLGYAALLRGDLAYAESLFKQTLREYFELGERTVIAESLEGLAAIFAMTNRSEPAVRLAAAAGSIRELNASRPLPFYHATIQQCLIKTREQLDEIVWARAWNEGRRMTMDEAVTIALG